MTGKSRITAVVPMKPLSDSKTRLSDHLSPSQRASLSLSMLSWVLGELRKSTVSRTIVIGGDDHVKSASLQEGAKWVQDDFLELNKAIEYIFNFVWQEGWSAAYIPADLPLLTSSDVDNAVEASEEGHYLTLCRAHDGGTNGLIIPPNTGFRPCLGTDSFRRHTEIAENLRLEWRNHHSEGFHHDVDTIKDLLFCLEKQPPCLTVIADSLEVEIE